ncbi:hypothetical protein [Amycolatopsis magusensis]|uniref:hypothetical protein n=1 Tax=Amycolatopsis magusensis TaxID=882444 RepID=UPI00378DB85B
MLALAGEAAALAVEDTSESRIFGHLGRLLGKPGGQFPEHHADRRGVTSVDPLAPPAERDTDLVADGIGREAGVQRGRAGAGARLRKSASARLTEMASDGCGRCARVMTQLPQWNQTSALARHARPVAGWCS